MESEHDPGLEAFTKKALSFLPTPEMPEDLHRELLAAARSERTRPERGLFALWRRSLAVRGGAAALACAAAVLGAGFYYLEAPVEVPVDALLKAHGEYARALVK
ncbi:MAG: hypothetical protein HY921_12510 [Elusimicrobia bacterium]|nr:hypothetical protein [Elusimicrobiota bacterium]